MVPATRRYRFSVTSHGGVRLTIDGRKVLENWNDREDSVDAGAVRLTAGRPHRLVLEYFTQAFTPAVSLRWDNPVRHEIEKAAEAAASCDFAVVVVGTDTSVENETLDRDDLGLPGVQEELALQVARSNPKCVVVLVNGGPISVPVLAAGVPAILEAWFPGEEGGTALGEVLFGVYNPGGKLPMTVPNSASDLPPFGDYDIRKGRTYMYARAAPLFPFGFGLSYTTFRLDGLRIPRANIAPEGEVEITVNVFNTGNRKGDEVVQLYLTFPGYAAKRLRGFERVSLNPGESRPVRFRLAGRSLESFDRDGVPSVLRGRYGVMVGTSSSGGVTGSFSVD